MVNTGKSGIVVLTEGRPWKCILRFALPLFLGSLLQQLYYTVDAMMVGRLVGEQALSGVGTCGVLTNLLVAFSVGFSAGASIVSAQYFGAKQYSDITKNAYAAMISLTLLGLVIGGIGFGFARPLLKVTVSVPDSLMGYAESYFRICAVGFIFQFIYNGIAALLRSIGDSKASLYFLLLSTVLNIFLDYISIQWFQMGVDGAAWSTVIAQLVSCAVSFAYMYRRYEVLQFLGKKIKISGSDVSIIIRMGFPMALQSMVGTVFNLFVQRLVNSFGEAMIASYTVVSRVEGYMQLPTQTLYQAIPTYTAQNLGAWKSGRIRVGLRHTVMMALLSTLLISVVTFFFTPAITSAFGISGLSQEYCISNIRWLSFPILLFALYFPCTGLYQGMGKGMVSTALSTTFLTVCLLLAYTLKMIPAIDFRSIFICKPIAWVIVSAINYVYYLAADGKMRVSCLWKERIEIMEYRLLPSGDEISTVGIGVGNYGYAGVSSAEIEKIFASAMEAGVNFFDTCMSLSAPSESIAKAIRGKRDKLIMQNHLCVCYPDGNYAHTTRLPEVKDCFAQELKKYGTDYSDIGIIHFVDEDKDIPEMVNNGIVDYAFQLKKEGIIRNVGFSSHTASVARKMLDVADFDVMFFGINAGYDYEPKDDGLELSVERTGLYRECAGRGMAVTVMKPYGNGQLLDNRLSPFGKSMTIPQCLQYALDRPAVVSCLVGAVTEREMSETLRYYETGITERDYSFIGGLQQSEMAGSCTYCGHCHPCPAGINIASVNKYYDLAKVGDKLAAQHYRALEHHASDCIGCGLCEQRCPFHVKAKERMENIIQYFHKTT